MLLLCLNVVRFNITFDFYVWSNLFNDQVSSIKNSQNVWILQQQEKFGKGTDT